MTEGPVQQPPQEPRNAPEGRREVLEGRIIPSRAQARRHFEAAPPEDPRQSLAGGDQDNTWGSSPSAPADPGLPWSSADPAPRAVPYTSSSPGGELPPQGSGFGAGSQFQDPGPVGGPAPRPPQSGFPAGPAPQGASGPAFPRQQAAAGRAAANRGSAGRPPVRDEPRTPDWGALADQQAAEGARRRKVMMLTGGIVAVAVIAGGVATAVVMSGKSSDAPIAGPSTGGTTTVSAQPLPPEPTFSSVAPPPPPNPLDYLSTAAKDKAPLTAGSLFPGKQFLMNGRVYVKTNTAVTVKCATGARSSLAQALTANGCRRLVRATYVNGGVAVTVAVALFDDKPHASKLQRVAQYIAPLNGGGVTDFCHAVACRMTSNAVGRYAYFAIAGLKNNKTITNKDTLVLRAANEASNFTFQRIIQRGRDAAAADPARD